MPDTVTFSKLAIGVLERKYPGLKTKGLRSDVRSFLLHYLEGYFAEEESAGSFDSEFTKSACIASSIKDLTRDLTFIPDAYRILVEENEIHLFEIEDTHPLSIDKLRMLTRCWLGFQEHGVTMRIFVSDRYGSLIRELDLDLFEMLLTEHGVP
jgi:hypothetical protein